jgi:hypothetical protein
MLQQPLVSGLTTQPGTNDDVRIHRSGVAPVCLVRPTLEAAEWIVAQECLPAAPRNCYTSDMEAP